MGAGIGHHRRANASGNADPHLEAAPTLSGQVLRQGGQGQAGLGSNPADPVVVGFELPGLAAVDQHQAGQSGIGHEHVASASEDAHRQAPRVRQTPPTFQVLDPPDPHQQVGRPTDAQRGLFGQRAAEPGLPRQ